MIDRDKWEAVASRDNSTCRNCGRPAIWKGTAQVAHIIAKSKPNLKKYGEAVIDHAENLALVCCVSPCNSAMMINPESLPGKKHIDRIKDLIDNEQG